MIGPWSQKPRPAVSGGERLLNDDGRKPKRCDPLSGMDPWLEHPALWPDVHNRLIVSIADELVPKVVPRYFVGLEQHTYLCRPGGTVLVGEPDIGISRTPGIATAPGLRGSLSTAGVGVLELDVEVPVKDSVEELVPRYPRDRDRQGGHGARSSLADEQVVPDGRKQYLKKRNRVLGTRTSLIEIDLLRAGKPMPITTRRPVKSHYRILVSRGKVRPRAKLYAFGGPGDPCGADPLVAEGQPPTLDLNAVLHAALRAGAVRPEAGLRESPGASVGRGRRRLGKRNRLVSVNSLGLIDGAGPAIQLDSLAFREAV